jgi:tripartite-type tricarboxylate transporter receptor subunit TctC
LGALMLTLPNVHAQDKYPSKPIRLMTPFSPGGGTDTLARLLQPDISKAIGQTIVVDNRPGAGGTIGTTMAATASPDGYTFIVVSASYGANELVHKLPFDSVTGIQPIILFGETGLVVTVHPAKPIKSIKELISHMKTNPGKLNFGSAGIGGLGHLSQELFKHMTKAKFTHIPFKGSGPVMTALLSAQVDSSFSSLVPSIPHIKAGRLRGLGITTPKRSHALPNLPTIGETVPGYEVTHWYGMWGPKGIPKDIVKLWNTEVAKVLRSERITKWFEHEGMVVAAGPPEQFENRIRNDVQKWRNLVKDANIVLRR